MHTCGFMEHIPLYTLPPLFLLLFLPFWAPQMVHLLPIPNVEWAVYDL